VEVQGTAEHTPFSEDEMKGLMAAADKGIQQLIAVQKTLLGEGVLKKERPASS
jgi:ribonuclease PH